MKDKNNKNIKYMKKRTIIKELLNKMRLIIQWMQEHNAMIEQLIESSAFFQSLMPQLLAEDREKHALVIQSLQNCLQSPHVETMHFLTVIEYVHAHTQSPFQKLLSIFALIAATKGMLQIYDRQKSKQYFCKNIRKDLLFWGLHSLDCAYAALIDYGASIKQPFNSRTYETQINKIVNCFHFYIQNQDLFPVTLEIWNYFFKFMLCFRLQEEKQKIIFKEILDIFLTYSHYSQIVLKNFKLGIQFLKTNINTFLYNPQRAFITIISRINLTELEKIWNLGSIGMLWTNEEVNNCFLNLIKQGLTENVYKIFNIFINYLQINKMNSYLLVAYQQNISKLFIFMKHPQLFSVPFRLLQKFILSPFPTLSLYDQFIQRSILLYSTLNIDSKQRKDLKKLLQAVSHLYRQTTNTIQINNLLNTNQNPSQLIQYEIQKYIQQFAWKIQSISESRQEDTRYKGLTNIGNSCYMNSFIQALFMTSQLRISLLTVSTLSLQDEFLKKKSDTSQTGGFLKAAREAIRPLAQLQRLFALLLKSKRTQISPLPIRNTASLDFRNSHQQDSIEFGRSFLDILQGAGFKSFFQGQIRCQITCGVCLAVRSKEQTFLDLILSTQQDQVTVQQMLQSYFQSQTISELTCDKCQQVAAQSKKVQHLNRFPPYLILTLKRFIYSSEEKKNKKVLYKANLKEVIYIQEILYSLYAIIVHRGPSANCGHYYTFARNATQWLCFNDAHVSCFPHFANVVEFLQTCAQDTPYILFYQNNPQQSDSIFMKPFILKKPLENYVEKDNLQFIQGTKKRLFKLWDFKLKPFKKNQDDQNEQDPRKKMNYDNFVS